MQYLLEETAFPKEAHTVQNPSVVASGKAASIDKGTPQASLRPIWILTRGYQAHVLPVRGSGPCRHSILASQSVPLSMLETRGITLSTIVIMDCTRGADSVLDAGSTFSDLAP